MYGIRRYPGAQLPENVMLIGGFRSLGTELHVTIMSGVLDGQHFSFDRENKDGQLKDSRWLISIGRHEDRDIYLPDDLFLSRLHAYIIREKDQWLLQDCDSTNGSFLEDGIQDKQFTGTIIIQPGQLFKLGRTWMRIDEQQ
ncbi:MAG: FHA domain-containing protein [Anaerolineaceae bacterium]|nr:FHA domain-containing protein [Anaerolineaceae bacterium]